MNLLSDQELEEARRDSAAAAAEHQLELTEERYEKKIRKLEEALESIRAENARLKNRVAYFERHAADPAGRW